MFKTLVRKFRGDNETKNSSAWNDNHEGLSELLNALYTRYVKHPSFYARIYFANSSPCLGELHAEQISYLTKQADILEMIHISDKKGMNHDVYAYGFQGFGIFGHELVIQFRNHEYRMELF